MARQLLLLQHAALVLAACALAAPAAAVRLPWSEQPCHDVRVGSVVPSGPSQDGDAGWRFSPAPGGEREAAYGAGRHGRRSEAQSRAH